MSARSTVRRGFSIAPLLIHSEAVPLAVQAALRAASEGPPERRALELESAARVLYREAGLDCGDALEIVGLAGAGSCGSPCS